MGVLSTIAIAALVLAPSTAGAGVPVGTAIMTQPGQSVRVTSGNSTTQFGIELPSGASCPGDTAHKGYHVFSYLIPKAVSPTAISFKTGLPSRYFGYFAEGRYYGAINTAEGTGQLVDLPVNFSMARWTTQDLLPGGVKSAAWQGGIACADINGVVTNYWNTDFEMTPSQSGKVSFDWRVLHQPTSSIDITLWVSVALIVIGALIGAGAVLMSRRQRRDRADV